MHKKREQADNMGPFKLLIAALRDEALPFHAYLQNLSDDEIADYLAKLDQLALAQLLAPVIQAVLDKKAFSVKELIKVLRDQSLPF